MMPSNGLIKLMEECGELVQIAAKKTRYPDSETHPDGLPLDPRLQEEMGDVLAAIDFVVEKLGLDRDAIDSRRLMKCELFRGWDNESE